MVTDSDTGSDQSKQSLAVQWSPGRLPGAEGLCKNLPDSNNFSQNREPASSESGQLGHQRAPTV